MPVSELRPAASDIKFVLFHCTSLLSLRRPAALIIQYHEKKPVRTRR